MCLLLIAKGIHTNYKIIIAANRDEFYDRPTMRAHFWNDSPSILAGKDMQAGGTWLGITKTGRISAITNFREGLQQKDNAPTRGLLPTDYLRGKINPLDYLNIVKQKANNYNGFNLILGDVENLYYFSNMQNSIEKLENGIYGLSNGLLNSNWPKIVESKIKFENVIRTNNFSAEELFNILNDRSIAKDDYLPNTGVDLNIERILSAVFIKTEKYGKRCSTVMTIERDNKVNIIERTFNNVDDNFTEAFYSFIIEEK